MGGTSWTLPRFNKPCRLLLELKRVTYPLRLRHLRYPFALEQLAKGYVLRGQGQRAPVLISIPSKASRSRNCSRVSPGSEVIHRRKVCSASSTRERRWPPI